MESNRIATMPNGLTALRLAMTVVAGAMFLAGGKDGAATAICIVVAALDGLDGWMARRFNQTSAFGAYLDPLADKLLMTLVYGMIAVKVGNSVLWGLFVLLVARDVVVTAKRSASLVRRGRCVSASLVGKIKMGVQSFGGLTVLGYAVWLSDGEILPAAPVMILFGLVTLLSYLSAWNYGVFALEGRNSGNAKDEI